MINQVSVFIENKVGRLYELTKVLGDAGVNIRALSLADTSDFGVARLIVDNPEETLNLLKSNQFTARLTSVLAIDVPDHPGGLAEVLKILGDLQTNVEYTYAFVEQNKDRALLIFRIEDPENVLESLTAKGIKVVTQEEILSL